MVVEAFSIMMINKALLGWLKLLQGVLFFHLDRDLSF